MTPKSPKTRFLSGPYAQEFSKLSSRVEFEVAADAALIQTQFNLPEGDAAANHHRMEGARLFLSILMTIGDSPVEAFKKSSSELQY